MDKYEIHLTSEAKKRIYPITVGVKGKHDYCLKLKDGSIIPWEGDNLSEDEQVKLTYELFSSKSKTI
jgi:hypothetical protein